VRGVCTSIAVMSISAAAFEPTVHLFVASGIQIRFLGFGFCLKQKFQISFKIKKSKIN